MSEEKILQAINDEFGDKIVESKVEPEHRLSVEVQKDNIIELANFVKHELGFTHPNMCTGIDQKEFMEVIWHVGISDSPILLAMRVKLDLKTPSVAALTNIWKGYNWHERETYDLLGVNFEDHPDLRRILMPETWEGHPLREDYVYKKPKYRKPED